jgi:hypothetical protein
MKKNYAIKLFFLGSVWTSLNGQVLFSESFNSSLGTASVSNSSNGAWVWTNSCSRSALTGHTAPGSAYFEGNGNSCQYADASGNAVSGDLSTPNLSIGSQGAILTFNYSLLNECGANNSSCFYDILKVQVSNNGGSSFTDIYTSNYSSPGGIYTSSGWVSLTYSLTAYANQSIIVRFDFNSVDGFGNNFDGVYIDDIRIENIQNCTTVPANAVAATSTLICPVIGTSVLSFTGSTAALVGLNYTWMESTTSAVGPFTVISGAIAPTYSATSLNQTTWYQAVIDCGFTSQSSTLGIVQVSVEPTVISSVPYFEGFEDITMDDQLPNCSWFASSNPGGNTQTYTSSQPSNRIPRTGNKFASFNGYFTIGTEEFWTNGIYMQPGVTYSASMWFTTEAFGYTNFADLTILLNSSQSNSGAYTIASTSGPALSPVYRSLSDTFSVSSPGIYYVGIQATSDGNCCAEFLSWDDLFIEIPCSLNTPTVSSSASSNTICSGQTLFLSATGADAYSWSTGDTTSVISPTPLYDVTYHVTGIDTLSGCSSISSQAITVNPTPNLVIYASPPVICAGDPAYLTASGSAISYTWNTNAPGSFLTVNPGSTTTYTVFGENMYNCIGQAVQVVSVNPLPNVTATADRAELCKGESVNLTAGGATNYQWSSVSSYLQGQQVSVSPNTGTTYTLNGTNSNGCSKTTTVSVDVLECVGLNQIVGNLTGVRVYPNPNTGIFTIELNNEVNKNIEVIDITGRVVASVTSKDEEIKIDISRFAAGIYYVRIQSDDAVETMKILKQ